LDSSSGFRRAIAGLILVTSIRILFPLDPESGLGFLSIAGSAVSIGVLDDGANHCPLGDESARLRRVQNRQSRRLLFSRRRAGWFKRIKHEKSPLISKRFNKKVHPSAPGAKPSMPGIRLMIQAQPPRNCFPGLATSWRILDRSVGTISTEPLHNPIGSRRSFQFYVDILRRVY